MKLYYSNSIKETKKIAANLAKGLTRGVIALSGDLGSGKTTFVQGIAYGLGIKEKISSPTFVLIRQHKIPNTGKFFYHLDLYRLGKGEDFKSLGLQELFSNPDNLIIIEWAEKIKDYLPNETTWIFFETTNVNQRKMTIK